MTVVTAPQDDIYFSKNTPVEDLKEACVDYFMKMYNWTDVSFYSVIDSLFRHKLKKRLKATSVTQVNWTRF